jgi:hypothetical protein
MTKKSLRDLASEVIASGEAWFMDARYKATEESRTARLYTLTIFEQFHATLCLLDHGYGTHCACQIRSMLEHLTDLFHVLNVPGYCLQLEQENAYSDNKVITNYRDAVAGDQPDEPMMAEITSLLAEIQSHHTGNSEISETGVDFWKTLRIWIDG